MASKALDRLLAIGPTVDHNLVEVDGVFCRPTAEAILAVYRADALIRIGRHLYVRRTALTLDAPAWKLLFPEDGCHAGRDGECNWTKCPQTRDGEPEKTRRHCPLDTHEERE